MSVTGGPVRNRRCPRRGALTLIEVLLVVALMAILAGLAIPNASPTAIEQLRSAANIVAADLAYARSQAVTCGSDFRARFRPDDGEYEIEHVGSNPAFDDVLRDPFSGDGSSSSRYLVRLADLPSLGPPVHVAAMATVDSQGNVQARVNDIVFRRLGETASSLDTRIWLTSGSGETEKSISIHVNSVTGLATVELPGQHAMPSGPAQTSPLGP